MFLATGDNSELDAGDGGSARIRARTGVCISGAAVEGLLWESKARRAALESEGGGLGVFSLSRTTRSGRVERLRAGLGAGSCACAAEEEDGSAEDVG